ncbi:glycosyltransferase [Mesorhizobium sp. B2-5-13]|uniref:glycosyltransferase family 4 protein n=1 Tax=unclassified Mesorhizobium TaxID=325217 RepID=UPI00112B0A85|nr:MULTISPECIES: glycosyltransferase family 4 protein [unclassified Mesorhizobium]TPJ43512.1 glycosyltransferase [Mesorhizobium sp. B2-6-5]TPJ93307.1 glycosyltransferase [Mesorhizobium sp. B2-5-13]TPK47608.1 glycosyltransferase [Mesorhizobium sp. B2-5-5]
MRILITNLFVSQNSGSESVVELLADGLRGAGHQTMLLAPMLGDMADRLRSRGHQVVDRIAEIIERPDVIHGQHLTPCLTAVARFPDVPAVFSCHSAFFEVEAPMLHPQIRHWIAVDEACKARCLSRGVPADRLDIVFNAVDLERFKQRPRLPSRPQRGLLLTKNFEHQQAVREACLKSGIHLDELGSATGRYSYQLEKDLLEYDIVFATARMAIEAAAVGCSVVVCDGRGFAGLLTAGNMEMWRRMNLGVGLLTRPTTIHDLLEAISRFDADDAAEVTAYFRGTVGAGDFIKEHLRIYDQAIQANSATTADERSLATACWIEEIGVSASPRKWLQIAKELHGLVGPETSLLQLLQSNTETLEGSAVALADLGGQVNSIKLDTAQLDSLSHASASIVNVTEITRDTLSRIDQNLAVLSDLASKLKRLYNSSTPLFLRKILLRMRERI